MSSTKAYNEAEEGIGISERDSKRCNVKKGSKLPRNSRSPSASGQKSKIPMNVGQIGRPGAGMQSLQLQDPSRMLTLVSSDLTTGGNASPISSARRLTSRSMSMASNPPAKSTVSGAKTSMITTGNPCVQKRQLENQFVTKKKLFARIKKELIDKQKNAADLYEEMTQLRETLITSGAKDPGKIETINLVGIPNERCSSEFCIDSNKFRGNDEQNFKQNSEITSEFTILLEDELREVPNRCLDMCKEMLLKRSEIIQWLTNFGREHIGSKIDVEIAKQVETYEKESSFLEHRLEEAKEAEEVKMNEIIKKVSNLWNEVDVSRGRICDLENTGEEIMKELREKMDALLLEKQSESEKCEQLKERKTVLEIELQKVRAKLRGLETRVIEDETKITHLQSNVKNLEAQMKQKESTAEQRLKDMQKSLKNSEILLAKAERQRENFESRLNELKKSSGCKETDAENKIKEMNEKLVTVNAELTAEREERRKIESKNESRTDNSELEIILEARDEKIAILELERKEIIGLIAQQLFANEVTFNLQDNDVHEKVLTAITEKMQEIRFDLAIAQDKNEKLQKEIEDLSTRLPTQSKESEGGGEKTMSPGQIIELQQQVRDLRCSTTELKRRNEQLEIQLNQKQLEIEQHDRAVHEQNNILKVRDEMICILREKLKLQESNVENEHISVDKQIVDKTEALQELCSTLEAKQLQITRLEDLVKQMEIQHLRAQEQRTRQEERIAQLQFALQCSKSRHHRYDMEAPVSSTKVYNSRFRDSSTNQQSQLRPATSSPLQNRPFHLHSFSRPAPHSPVESPLRYQPTPKMQRSKTLNSFNSKSKPLLNSNEYTSRVIDEVARTLKRERAYEYEKRALRDGCMIYSKEGRRFPFVDENVSDPLNISKREIQESFYNWLMKPQVFEETKVNAVHPTQTSHRNHWSNERTTINSESSVVVHSEDRSSRRYRTVTDCSRESRCGSPGCRRRNVPGWNCSAIPTKVRTNPQDNVVTPSRRRRS